jgi:CRP/FNR family transcriptional regulator, cyclic AMP receptor protein
MDEGESGTIAADAWFGSVPPDRRAVLLRAGQTVRLARGQRAYSIGDAPNGLWAVLEGQVRLKGHPAPGLEMLALSLAPGEWFGEMSTIDDGPRPHDAVAHAPSRLLHIGASAFRALVAEVPLLYHDLARLSCWRQRLALDLISHFSVPPRPRVARFLLARTSAEAPEVRLRQEDLAAMLGLSRQTLNRYLGQSAAMGAIGLAYGGIRIEDRPLLERLAQHVA